MTTVRISPRYKVVIPKEIRRRLKLNPGQKLQFFEFENRIELVPLKNIEEARGLLKGMDTNVVMEKDRL